MPEKQNQSLGTAGREGGGGAEGEKGWGWGGVVLLIILFNLFLGPLLSVDDSTSPVRGGSCRQRSNGRDAFA